MTTTSVDSRSADLAIVRERDRPRYLGALFAPAPQRRDLLALAALAARLGAQAERAGDPNLRAIRLRWWADAIASAASGNGTPAPELEGVGDLLARHGLDAGPLATLAEAEGDLAGLDAAPDRDDLERLLGETQSVLFQIGAAMALGREAARPLADASGHGGVAYGIVRLLRSAPFDEEMRMSLAALGLDHLDRAADALAGAPDAARPVLLPLAVLRPALRAAARGKPIRPAPFRDVARITHAALGASWRRP